MMCLISADVLTRVCFNGLALSVQFCVCVCSQFELILAAYRAESTQSKGTLAALKEVRARGRKRVMLG